MYSKDRSIRTAILCIIVQLFCLLSLSNGKSKSLPNIIFFLMDDIGWMDVSFNNGQFPTPNIDSLHTNGVSLERHYIHLMCSPSRSQIITGRYAMYQGYGKMLPWDYTEIGGIPQGQPTIASWLKWGGYTTYAVGKWHMGYAADILLPLNRGFDHFYGFYQGAIHYDNLKYVDIYYGDSNHYDFWEDAHETKELANDIRIRQEVITKWKEEGILATELSAELNEIDINEASIYDDNTMYLYRDKIIQYIDNQIYLYNELGEKKKKKHSTPFYMYLALQTIHGPLNKVPDKVNQCKDILPKDAAGRRHKYCQNMLLTDDVIGDVINKIKDSGIWDNTLIIFTSDNGGDISNKGCNYPLRGTKGTLFDGNLRTIAVVSGGIIPEIQRGTTRNILFSALDWTPTLLNYANLLHKIDKPSMLWDGINQYDIIMRGKTDKEKLRDHIVMNIGLKNLDSASIVFKYNDKLYKYVSMFDDIDRWAYIRDDGWCIPDKDNNFGLVMDEDISVAQPIDNKYLFDLTDDIAEKINLLHFNRNEKLIEYAKNILIRYTKHHLFSEPLPFLWKRHPSGNPINFEDGSFVFPFLTDDRYVSYVIDGFRQIDIKTNELAEELGVAADTIQPYSKALQQTYFEEWQPPILHNDNDDDQTLFSQILQIKNKSINISNICLFFLFPLCIMILLYIVYKYYYRYNNNDKKNGYQAFNINENTALIAI